MKHSRHSESGLLFDWHRQERRGTWLLLCFIGTIGCFALLSLLFRIVTPESPKLTSRPQQMIVLNPNVETDKALINRAIDRSFTLLPSEPLNLRDVPREAKIPAYEPPISQFELKLKAPQMRASNRESPLLFTEEIDVLPALPRLTPTTLKPTPKVTLQAQIESERALRLISPSTLDDIPLTDPSRAYFRVAVGSLGQVIMAMPITASEDPDVMVKLHTALTQMRFEPTGKELEWAQVSFAWLKEVKP